MKKLKHAIVLLLFCTTGAIAQQKPNPLTREAKGQIIDTIVKKLNANYVFADTAARMGKYIESRFKAGAYDTTRNREVFAKQLTDDIRSVYMDRHSGVRYMPRMAAMLAKGGAQNDPAEQKQEMDMAKSTNFDFNKAAVLEGNIGYIKLDGFSEVNAESKKTVKAAFSFVAHCAALIIDLRENHGGEPEMVAYICSFLFKDKTHLNDLYERRTNNLQTYWTNPDTTYSSLFNVPVYVLTSKYTFSGGEEFAYDMQTQKRATILGETTGGGAHPVEPANVGYGFVVWVPYARAINPITKTNWEGVGVKPDVAVDADKALNVTLDKIKATMPKREMIMN